MTSMSTQIELLKEQCQAWESMYDEDMGKLLSELDYWKKRCVELERKAEAGAETARKLRHV